MSQRAVRSLAASLRRALAGALLALAVAPAFAAPEAGVAWSSLGPADRQVLASLERDWDRLDAASQQKWLKVAERFARLAPEDQVRIRARMGEWSRLTPGERARARQQFIDSRDWPARDRQERWQAYQALSPEQRQALAEAALPQPAAIPAGSAPVAMSRSALVTAPPASAAARPAAVQVRPGATTKPLIVRSSPPPHQQAGMPKIAATPAFVDPATLLPRRGPQAAAMQSAADSAAPAPVR